MFAYRQQTGELLDAAGAVIGVGYSGIGDGKNNPAMQMVKGRGPIPEGLYTIGEERDDAQLGPVVMPLTPDAGDDEFGRCDFFMHGDSATHPGQASHGCIVMARSVRDLVSASADRRLQVVAR
jgi:hypothetical protein